MPPKTWKKPAFVDKTREKYKSFIEKQRKNGNIDRVETGMQQFGRYMKEIEDLSIRSITRHPYWQGTRFGLHLGQKAAYKLFYDEEVVVDVPKISYTSTFSKLSAAPPILSRCMLPCGHAATTMIASNPRGTLVSLPYAATVRDVHIYWLLKDKIAIGHIANRNNVRSIPDPLPSSGYFIYLTDQAKTVKEVNRLRKEAGLLVRKIFGLKTISYTDKFGETLRNDQVILDPDDDLDVSLIGTEVLKEEASCEIDLHEDERYLVNRYVDYKGVYKAVYVGPPGTGKSLLARRIARERGSFYTGAAHNTAKSKIFGAYPLAFVRIGNLKSVIIEDIDRGIRDDKTVLSLLDFLNTPPAGIEYIAITCNNLKKLPPALYRAGRVDEVREILHMPPKQAHGLLVPHEVPEKFLEEVRRWPVAYIVDLKNKLDIFGVKNTQQLIETISRRVEICNKEYEGL
jgi:hypothetical protein